MDGRFVKRSLTELFVHPCTTSKELQAAESSCTANCCGTKSRAVTDLPEPMVPMRTKATMPEIGMATVTTSSQAFFTRKNKIK